MYRTNRTRPFSIPTGTFSEIGHIKTYGIFHKENRVRGIFYYHYRNIIRPVIQKITRNLQYTFNQTFREGFRLAAYIEDTFARHIVQKYTQIQVSFFKHIPEFKTNFQRSSDINILTAINQLR